MKPLVLTIVLALFLPAALHADEAGSAERTRELKRARTTIWTGVALMAAGVALAPVTAVEWRGAPRGPVVAASMGLVGAGSAITYIGFRQQRRAARPSTAFAVVVGQQTGVAVRRTW